MTTGEYITKHYNDWLSLARKVARKNIEPDELLHHTIEHILQHGKDKVPGLVERDELHPYVCKAIRMASGLQSSTFNHNRRHENSRTDFKESHINHDGPFMGALLDRETLDCLVQRLPKDDRDLFTEYLKPEFRFRKFAAQKGIPPKTLHNQITRIKNELKSVIVIESPDIIFTRKQLVAIADKDGKILYIGGAGGASSLCVFQSDIEITLRRDHKVTDFNKWQCVMATDEGMHKLMSTPGKKIKIKL